MILRENGGKGKREGADRERSFFFHPSISKRLLPSRLYSLPLPPPFLPPLPFGGRRAAVLRFSTFSRFIPAASSLNRFPGEIYGRAIIHGGGGEGEEGGQRGEESGGEVGAFPARSSSSSSPPDRLPPPPPLSLRPSLVHRTPSRTPREVYIASFTPTRCISFYGTLIGADR